jgi:acylphosphatase
MSRRRIHVLLAGRVQGVFFRRSAAEAAARLGVCGWVKNLPDGRVELEAEGPPEALEAFLTFCRRGPERARVEEVLVVDRPARGDVGFQVEDGG